MLRMDEVEKLSRLRSGELSAQDAAAVRADLEKNPELQRAYARLEKLDALAGDEAEQQPISREDEAMIARLVAKEPQRSRRWVPLMIAAGVGALIATGTWIATRGEDAPRNVEPMAVQTPAPAPGVAPDPGQSGPLDLPLRSGAIAASPDTRVGITEDGRVVMFSGTALFRSEDPVTVMFAEHELSLEGEALLTTEGDRAAERLAASGDPKAPGQVAPYLAVISGWKGQPAAALSLSGSIKVRPRSGGPESTISRGNAWVPSVGRVQQAVDSEVPQKPAAKPEARVTSGQLELAAVHKVMYGAAQELAACFEAGLAQTPGMSGTVTLQLTIAPAETAGRLSEATVGDYSLANPLVASCFLEKLSKLSWPSPGANAATVEYPLVFQARGDSSTGGTSIRYPGTDAIHNTDRVARQDVRIGDAPSLGQSGAPVDVVVFSDFDCSFCLKAFPALSALQQKYGARIRVAFKHKPLPSHPNARLSSSAAIAAEEQGKFWEYAELLVKNPGARDRNALERYAAQLGLDVLRFRAAMDSERVRARIDADVAEADRVGASGIPDFFINGREIVGARPVEQYERVIDEELARLGR